jgi:hypothetical protein
MGGRRFDVESDLIFNIKKPIGLKANTDRQGKGPIKVETIQPPKAFLPQISPIITDLYRPSTAYFTKSDKIDCISICGICAICGVPSYISAVNGENSY